MADVREPASKRQRRDAEPSNKDGPHDPADDEVAPADTRSFLSQPSGSLTCPICMAVLNDAATLVACQHVFCRSCITEALRRNRACPTCRKPVSSAARIDSVVAKNHLVNNIIGEMKVHCRFGLAQLPGGEWVAQKGPRRCSKVLTVDEVPGHEARCPFARIPCPFKGCGTVVLRRELQQHLEGSMGRHLAALQSELELKDTQLKESEARADRLEGRLRALEDRVDRASSSRVRPDQNSSL